MAALDPNWLKRHLTKTTALTGTCVLLLIVSLISARGWYAATHTAAQSGSAPASQTTGQPTTVQTPANGSQPQQNQANDQPGWAKFISNTFNLNRDDFILSVIVLAGFILTVAFIAALGMVYAGMGVADKTMPLALPEGSVRALLAFSLVLIFVCVSTFLFSEVEMKQGGAGLSGVTADQLADLRTNFIVAAELARDADQKQVYQKVADPQNKSVTVDDLAHPLYNVTYYPRVSKDAADFAKQIFTTLATIFISVVSFYFGSSTTSSAVKAGSTQASQSGPDGLKMKAITDANDAHSDVQNAQDRLNEAVAAGRTDLDSLKQNLENAKNAQKEKQALALSLQK